MRKWDELFTQPTPFRVTTHPIYNEGRGRSPRSSLERNQIFRNQFAGRFEGLNLGAINSHLNHATYTSRHCDDIDGLSCGRQLFCHLETQQVRNGDVLGAHSIGHTLGTDDQHTLPILLLQDDSNTLAIICKIFCDKFDLATFTNQLSDCPKFNPVFTNVVCKFKCHKFRCVLFSVGVSPTTPNLGGVVIGSSPLPHVHD